MNTSFDTSYIQLAYQMLQTSEKPYEVAQSKKKLLNELTAYKEKLEKFEPFFELYPALKKDLFGNLWEYKVGAFFQDQLVTFFYELEKVEELKSELQKLITLLYKEYNTETNTWLPEYEEKINSYIVHLSVGSIKQIIEFLQGSIASLREQFEDLNRLEKRRLADITNARNRQNEDTERMRAEEDKKRRSQLSEQEREDKRRQAKEEFERQMRIRRK